MMTADKGRARRWGEYLLVLALLLGHALVQAHLAWEDSDVIDEPGHLVAALAYTRKGTFRLYNVNPPLPRLVQGAFLLGVPLDTSMIVEPSYRSERRELGVGSMFIHAQAEQYRAILFRARLGTVVFVVLGGVLVWVWGNLAFGRPCGLLALAIWCSNPSVLAHGHLATPDLSSAVLALAAALAFRAYLVAPSWRWATAAGVLLGLAQLTKFTLLLLYPLWLLFWLVALLRVQPGDPARRPGVMLWHSLVAVALSLLTLNAGYLFQDSGQPLERYRFLSTKMNRLSPETIESLGGPTNALGETWLGKVPVPLPAPYLEGIDLQAVDFDRYAAFQSSFFLAGRWVKGGRYHYYLYGLLVKTPLALFGLLGVAGVLLWYRPGRPVDLALLLLVPLAILVFVSAQTSMNKHVRYVLPMLPFLVVLAGAAGRVWQGPRRWPRVLVGVLLVWLVVAGVRSCRDPVAYFNEAVGGPRGGVQHLAGSNVDWGQGRYRLRNWLEARPDFRPVGVACYSTGAHIFAGMQVDLPPVGPGSDPIPTDLTEQRRLGPHPGRFAIGVRILQGDLKVVQDAEGHGHKLGGRSYTYFQRFEPVATVGDSVWIFDISLEEANRVRADLGLVALEGP
jgi:hypothetical protein